MVKDTPVPFLLVLEKDFFDLPLDLKTIFCGIVAVAL